MYVCGMTVYDYCHVGHARLLMVFDVVRRYLRHRGYQVTYVRNITDIDDKIIQRAAAERRADRGADRALHRRDARGLRGARLRAARSRAARHRVRAGDHRDDQRADAARARLRRRRRRRLYAVAKFPGYGRLSGKRLDGPARRRARRGRRRQARSAGFRAVEAGQARRAVVGLALGRRAVPAGTSSARPCRWRCSATTSTSTAAAWT